MKREINPSETSRAQAFNYWMKSPMPMVTITKTFDVTKIYKLSKQKGYKFNMLLCWCIGSYRHRNRLHCQPIFRRLLQPVSLVGQIPKALVPSNFAHIVSIPSRSNGRRARGEVFGEVGGGVAKYRQKIILTFSKKLIIFTPQQKCDYYCYKFKLHKRQKKRLINMAFTFRHNAGFGKRIEYYIIGLMLKEGLDCYVPLVDDDGIDCVVRQNNGHFIEVQIKARSNDVKMGDAALFAALDHEQRSNYFFIFYSERLQKIWIMSSEEFLQECVTNQNGKNAGKHSIWFNGCKKNSDGQQIEYAKDKFNKYLDDGHFSRLKY